MSAIRDGRLPIELDKERHLLFSLNAIDEMTDEFGGFDKLDEALSGQGAMKNLRWMLTLLLNEGAEEGEAELTEKQVGRLIHTGNLSEVKTAMFRAFALGNTGKPDIDGEDEDEDTDDDEGDAGNAKAGKE